MSDVSEYDDKEEVTKYIVSNHLSLLTPFENRVEKAAHAREKFGGVSGEHAQHIMDRYASIDDEEVNAALEHGIDAFRQTVVDRILKSSETQH